MMSNKISRIFILFSVLALVACSESVDIQLEPEVDLYLSSDSEPAIRLTAADKEYAALSTWLRDHRSGWYSTAGRYHGGVYVQSGSYGIQITKLNVVIYTTSAAEPRAIYIQKIEPGELSGIRKLGK